LSSVNIEFKIEFFGITRIKKEEDKYFFKNKQSL